MSISTLSTKDYTKSSSLTPLIVLFTMMINTTLHGQTKMKKASDFAKIPVSQLPTSPNSTPYQHKTIKLTTTHVDTKDHSNYDGSLYPNDIDGICYALYSERLINDVNIISELTDTYTLKILQSRIQKYLQQSHHRAENMDYARRLLTTVIHRLSPANHHLSQ